MRPRGIWVSLLRVPYFILVPLIVLFCSIGAFSSGYSAFEVGLTALFAILGFLVLWFRCSPAPVALGFILGPMLEENFRRAMVLSRGDITTFTQHPVSACFLAATAVLLAAIALPALARARADAFGSERL